jgi:hypothetical protein
MTMLTVEVQLDPDASADARVSEVAICFDDEGLKYLLKKLQWLRGRADHLHLMTEAWGGQGLDEQRQGGPDCILVHHLRIVNKR